MDEQSACQYSFPACITYLTSFPEAPCDHLQVRDKPEEPQRQ